MTNNQYCIIMAGGAGSRFWPMSRGSRPKQFLDILGAGKSFLQETFARFARIVPAENIFIVTGTAYIELVLQQLPDIDPSQILAEPLRRNTAPCIAYAAYRIMARNPHATMVVTPADHYIANEEEFLQVICNGLNFAANNDSLITLGIQPTRPETNYGYIQFSLAEQQDFGKQKVYRVKTFTEKPNAELAKIFIDSGEFLWNSGIFIWNVKTICRALKKYLPDIAVLFEKGAGRYNTPDEPAFIAEAYAECRNISIDYGIMEKADNAYCFAGHFGWSDLGTWYSLYAHKPKDADGNVIVAAETMLYDVSGSIVLSADRQKLLVLRGLENYLVIDSDDVLMICPNNDSDVKEIIKDVPVKKGNKYM
ncbi:MAG: mannose-1-phosphate guanylyltransferase [Prevotellaceae bacterium]|jgi:mannose-1-phosphate guanylyltransferase|nr:mannose-1-phosphate guanylyltransferase [Prevotellaceae bacterium]